MNSALTIFVCDMKVAFYPASVLIPVGLLTTGWTVEYKAHWIGADIVGLIPASLFILLNQYGVGSHPRRSRCHSCLPRHSSIYNRLVCIACSFRQVSFAIHSNNSPTHSPISRSPRRSNCPALTCWFRIPHIRTGDVQVPGLRHRQHSTGGGCRCHRCTRVRIAVVYSFH